MTHSRSRPAIGVVVYFSLAFVLGMYFTYASVQGDYGIFRRVQIDAEAAELRDELAGLEAEVAKLSNKTRRLSDAYLDLDLLDEQARDVLGMVRADEIVLR
ncbi:FtsB family cell division protein [Tranquillimonas alkanivorans]|uniref:Cell division protein FtsB n=1 Tax=Tranquillimonas alkanivorans TaxID=441119 RepID=A0A1I5MH25_9RHOB|nr:septum formation initiator family protein [Tranquillimonas alkanivorans]SFP08819.1 Cell division protein FtsB [Tranquillimonas alkanivorans]